MSRKISIALVLAVLAAFISYAAWKVLLAPSDLPPEGFARGNGRVEADLIDISTQMAGRVSEISVREGDLVQPGDVLSVMDTDVLQAQKMQAQAAVASAEAAVGVAQAGVAQAEANLALSQSELTRNETLSARDVVSQANLDISRTKVQVDAASLEAAKATLVAKQRAVDAENANLRGIEKNITDSTLRAPEAGRVLYRLAQPGEVLGSGGKVLTLVSLGDVYMEFFLSASDAPRVRLGDEARIVVDIMPDFAVPAIVSFVAPQAQFTPKQVETIEERESLMFRVRVRIPQDLVAARLAQVKTGVRGVAWVRLAMPDGTVPDWPDGLTPPLVSALPAPQDGAASSGVTPSISGAEQ
jgi:HlyD family secretion protein